MTSISTKINDNLYYDERSAGGIAYKIENGKVFWLLIKTLHKSENRRSRFVYKFPKGHLKTDEFLKDAALREVEEEGKIKAKIINKLGSNNYIIWEKIGKRKIIKKVTFFLMEYLSPSSLRHYDTEMVMDREWLNYEDANKKLAYDSEKILLKKAKQKLGSLIK